MLPSLSLKRIDDYDARRSRGGRGPRPRAASEEEKEEGSHQRGRGPGGGGGFLSNDERTVSSSRSDDRNLEVHHYRPRIRPGLLLAQKKKEFHRYDFTDENGGPQGDEPPPSPSPCHTVDNNNGPEANRFRNPEDGDGSTTAASGGMTDEEEEEDGAASPTTASPDDSVLDECEEDAKEEDEGVDEKRKIHESRCVNVASVQVYVAAARRTTAWTGTTRDEEENFGVSGEQYGHDGEEQEEEEEEEEEKAGDPGWRIGMLAGAATDVVDHPSSSMRTRSSTERAVVLRRRKGVEEQDSSSQIDEDVPRSDPARSSCRRMPRRRSGWDVEVRLGAGANEREEDELGARRRHRRQRRPTPGTAVAVAYQSFAILQCSAPALIPYLVPIPSKENETKYDDDRNYHQRSTVSSLTGSDPVPVYRLSLPNASYDDWRLLEPFLQPPTLTPTEGGLQTATLTPQHLVLLPWFVQLRLDVLVHQSDDILSHIAWDEARDPIRELLIWSNIAQSANLPRTSQCACQAWQRLLCPSSCEVGHTTQPPVLRLADEYESLASLCRLLDSWVYGRCHVWIHLVRYLPHDLHVLGGSAHEVGADVDETEGPVAQLLKNPLLPYLIREGMYRHCAELLDHCSARGPAEPTYTASEPIGSGTVASDLQYHRGSIGPTLVSPVPSSSSSSCVGVSPSVASTRKRATTARRRQGRHDSQEQRLGSAGSFDELGEWQASFEQWFRWLVPTQDEMDDVAADIVYCPSSRTSSVVNEDFGWDSGSVVSSTPLTDILSQIPTNRLQWLEEVWRRLQEPPILPSVPESSARDGVGGAPQLPSRQIAPYRQHEKKEAANRRNLSIQLAMCSTPPRSRNARGTVAESPGATERRSSHRCQVQTHRLSSPARSSPRSRSATTGNGSVGSTSYGSKNDESNSSTLSTHPLNVSTDGSEETSYSSIGVVRARTRTFYC